MAKQTLSAKEILHLTQLAKLSLNEQEVKKYQEQLSETLDYVKNLEEITPNDVVNGRDHSLEEEKNVFFRDKISLQRTLTNEKALQNAKKKKGQYFVVERIL